MWLYQFREFFSDVSTVLVLALLKLMSSVLFSENLCKKVKNDKDKETPRMHELQRENHVPFSSCHPQSSVS